MKNTPLDPEIIEVRWRKFEMTSGICNRLKYFYPRFFSPIHTFLLSLLQSKHLWYQAI